MSRRAGRAFAVEFDDDVDAGVAAFRKGWTEENQSRYREMVQTNHTPAQMGTPQASNIFKQHIACDDCPIQALPQQ